MVLKRKWLEVLSNETGELFMSISFTQFNVADGVDLIQAARTLSKSLFEFGFYSRDSLVSVSYDDEMNAFVDAQDLGVAPNQLMFASKPVDIIELQTGFAISYVNPTLEVSLTARLINYNESSICIVEINDRHFYTLFNPENLKIFTGLLLASCKCIGGLAGFGAMEVEWEPYNKNEVVRFLSDGPPEYEGKQPPVGIIKTDYLNSNRLLVGDLQLHFDFVVAEEYTILLRKGAAELFSSL